MNLLRFLLAVLGGCATYTTASVVLGPEAPMATVGGFSFDPATLYAIAGVVVAMYMPEGFLKQLVQSFLKQKSGNFDTTLIEKLIKEAGDLYPVLVEIYKRMKDEGASDEELGALKKLAGMEHDKKFGVDFKNE